MALQIWPKLGFLVWKQTVWQHWTSLSPGGNETCLSAMWAVDYFFLSRFWNFSLLIGTKVHLTMSKASGRFNYAHYIEFLVMTTHSGVHKSL
jgi:hypothetical protein